SRNSYRAIAAESTVAARDNRLSPSQTIEEAAPAHAACRRSRAIRALSDLSGFVRFNMSVGLIQLRRTVSARSFYVRVETDKAGQIGQSADRSAAAVNTSRLVG